jgi:prepilin-type N-terminal cleavage/methylation domain-containing protein/prepilin-type processing-associated H-X9-DG protein
MVSKLFGFPGCRRLQHVSRAFTLVELLTVIAIIGVLLGILLPVLASAKQSGRATACLNNHRQLIVGWSQYNSDHEDLLPWNVDDGDNEPFTNWVAGTVRNATDATNSALLVDSNRSLLGFYLKEPKIFKCPSDPSVFVRSVSMNNRMNPVRFKKPPLVLGGWGTNFAVYRRQSDIRSPDRIFVIIDERHDSINEGNFAVDLSNTGNLSGDGIRVPYWWLDTPASYHRNGVTLSFADSHVETYRWKEKTTLGPLGETGFRYTTPGDKDIAWLQYRTAESIP